MQFKFDEKKNFKVLKFLPKLASLPMGLSFIISLLILAISLLLFQSLQPQIPIFYSLALPSQQLAKKEWLLLLPALSIFITTVHLAIIISFSGIHKNLIKLFSWMTLILQIVLLAIFSRIILLVI